MNIRVLYNSEDFTKELENFRKATKEDTTLEKLVVIKGKLGPGMGGGGGTDYLTYIFSVIFWGVLSNAVWDALKKLISSIDLNKYTNKRIRLEFFIEEKNCLLVFILTLHTGSNILMGLTSIRNVCDIVRNLPRIVSLGEQATFHWFHNHWQLTNTN
jgi:hypothetical protein